MERMQLMNLSSGILFGIAFFLFWKRLKQQTTSTHPVTWLLLATLNVSIFCSMLIGGAFNWQIAVAVVGSIFIYNEARKQGSHEWDSWTITWAAIAAVGWIVWLLSDNVQIALDISAAVSVASAMPLFRRTWRQPYSEPLVPWGLFWASCWLNLFAVPIWTARVHWIQPVSFFAVDGVMVMLILRGTFTMRHNNNTRGI